MSLSIRCKIIEILAVENGTSKSGKEWQKQNFVVDTYAQFNPNVCFNVFGDEKIKILAGFETGQEVDVSFNVSSREFNGKYYHNIDAWKIKAVDALENEPVATATDENDLPF